MSVFMSSLESITNVSALNFPTVPNMYCVSFCMVCDLRVAVQVMFCWMLLTLFVQESTKIYSAFLI